MSRSKKDIHSLPEECRFLLDMEGGIKVDNIQYYGGILVVICNDQRVLSINKKGCQILGYREEGVVGKNWFDDFVPDATRDELKWTFARFIKGMFDTYSFFEYSVVTADGEKRLVAWHNAVIRDNDGAVRAVIGSGEDITGTMKLEEDLRASEGKLRAMLESISDHMSMMDRDLNIIWANKTAKRMFGSNIIGRKCYEVYHGLEKPCEPYPCLTLKAFKDGKSHEHETHVKDKDDNILYFHCTANVAMRDKEGIPSAVMEVSRNITNAKQAEESLRKQACYDILTSLPNRKFFMDRLKTSLDLSKRYSNRAFAVAFLDLDRFKLINDSLGHHAGDELLVAVSKRLGKCVRSSDTVARLGGDEFAILFENDISEINALKLAERILKNLSESYLIEKNEIFVTASIGLVMSDKRYLDAEDILRDADIAMYEAKSSGRSCCRIFDSVMHLRSLELLRLETELRRAVEAREFSVYYQPIVSLDSGKVVAAEALIRWMHPELGLLLPDDFLPLAEETGLIVPIGEWILESACSQGRIWQKGGHPGLRIAVNLSSRQLQQKDLYKRVNGILKRTGFPARDLEFEVEESLFVTKNVYGVNMLNELSGIGVRICLEGFGTGFSSILHMKDLPIHSLKLDRQFIADLPVSREDKELARAIINIARTLKLNVIGEGVEKADLRDFLYEAGCNEGQGFLFSMPLTAEDFTGLINGQA